MAGFDFGQISSIVDDVMDTDLMDVGRRESIINPDGSVGETNPEIPKYENLPCHIEFNQADNPDPQSIDTKPIIISITIHCATWIDLQNADFIYAKKLDSNGEIMEIYTGTIGNPIMHQSRQSAIMTVRQFV